MGHGDSLAGPSQIVPDRARSPQISPDRARSRQAVSGISLRFRVRTFGSPACYRWHVFGRPRHSREFLRGNGHQGVQKRCQTCHPLKFLRVIKSLGANPGVQMEAGAPRGRTLCSRWQAGAARRRTLFPKWLAGPPRVQTLCRKWQGRASRV